MMIRKNAIASVLMLSANLAILAGCNPAPVVNQPKPTPSPTASTQPSGNPSASPSSSTQPSASPSSSTLPTSTPSPSQPAGSATPTPNATPTGDTSVYEPTTLNGKVFDDSNAPLDGITIRARSLSSYVPFDATTTTSGGSYAFNNAPAGVTLEITASRLGYTSRRRVEVLKSNKNGDPNANRYDFGNDGSTTTFGVAYNALSDKPEVTAVTPGRNASGIDAKTSLVLKFSEPMDKATVQDNLEIYAFNNKKFTDDTGVNASTVTGSGDVNSVAGSTRIWDKAAFNVSWNSDDTEATFTFKEERMLPTDRDSSKTPDYQVSLNRQDGSIKDKSGISRTAGDKKFKLTDGDFERSYKFSIKTDEKKPTVDSMMAQTAENSGVNSDGDVIKVRFSERMIHYTLGPTIAGGMGGVASQAAGANNALTGNQVAPNYKVTVVRAASTLMNQTTWANLGGRAIFDTNDPSHKTVLLLPPRNTNASLADVRLNNQSFTATGTFSTDGADGGSDDSASISFIKADGSVSTQTVNLAENLANTAAVGTDLLTRLNAAAAAAAPAASASPFTVGVAGNVLTLNFNDTSGNYIGFRMAANWAGTGPILPASGVSYANNQSLDIYKPGDNVIVKVDTTVLDPAGNSVDSSSDNASANAS